MMKTRERTLRTACGTLLALALLAPAAAPILAKASGSVRTTDAGCGTRNDNRYATGDWVYLRGDNFEAETSVQWAIAGLSGGASTGPGQEVASGTKITDTVGSFCFAAYQIAVGDAGEYRATVTVGSATKSDNYRVDGTTTDGSTGGTGDTTGGTGDTTGGTGGTTGGTGGTTGGTSDTGAIGDTTGSTGGIGDTTGGTDPAQPVLGAPAQGSNAPAGSNDVTGVSSDPTSVSTPTQTVLGAVSSHGSIGSLPSTDTVSSASSNGFALLISGLAGLAAAAILLPPSRRRGEDRG